VNAQDNGIVGSLIAVKIDDHYSTVNQKGNLKSLDARYRTQPENVASLTGWDMQEIYKKMDFQPTDGNKRWWQKIWQ
jgi:hypothetical protein